MRSLRWSVSFVFGLAMLVAVVGCGGDDDDDDAATATNDQAGTATSEPAGSTATSADAGGDDAIDVCALLSPEEVSTALGAEAPEGESEAPVPPFFGCDWDTGEQSLAVSVIKWPNEDDAKSSMDLETENNDYPAIDGLGDEAYNTQPIDDVTVRAGRYEISIGLSFVSDDDEEELARATEVARIIVSGLE